jgi:hypothetical protein
MSPQPRALRHADFLALKTKVSPYMIVKDAGGQPRRPPLTGGPPSLGANEPSKKRYRSAEGDEHPTADARRIMLQDVQVSALGPFKDT